MRDRVDHPPVQQRQPRRSERALDARAVAPVPQQVGRRTLVAAERVAAVHERHGNVRLPVPAPHARPVAREVGGVVSRHVLGLEHPPRRRVRELHGDRRRGRHEGVVRQSDVREGRVAVGTDSGVARGLGEVEPYHRRDGEVASGSDDIVSVRLVDVDLEDPHSGQPVLPAGDHRVRLRGVRGREDRNPLIGDGELRESLVQRWAQIECHFSLTSSDLSCPPSNAASPDPARVTSSHRSIPSSPTRHARRLKLGVFPPSPRFVCTSQCPRQCPTRYTTPARGGRPFSSPTPYLPCVRGGGRRTEPRWPPSSPTGSGGTARRTTWRSAGCTARRPPRIGARPPGPRSIYRRRRAPGGGTACEACGSRRAPPRRVPRPRPRPGYRRTGAASSACPRRSRPAPPPRLFLPTPASPRAASTLSRSTTPSPSPRKPRPPAGRSCKPLRGFR